MEVNLSWWVIFHVLVFFMLALDLGFFNKKDHEISIKESLIWTFVWIFIAMCFNLAVYFYLGHKPAYEFLTGYVLEKSLSVDNIFVMTVIFAHFKVPNMYQHRVLFWGILGALLMRIVFILGGVALLAKFHFLIYIFGAFLVYTGIKLLKSDSSEKDLENDFTVKLCKKFFRLSMDDHKEHFFVKLNGKWHITTLFLVLLVIESTDLVFALDSIPATLSVTRDPFIAYTSNIFAILGLRSLYFAFVGVVGLFNYLTYALSIVLIFIGCKMLLESYVKIPTSISLAIVLGTISISIIASVVEKKFFRKKIVAKGKQ